MKGESNQCKRHDEGQKEHDKICLSKPSPEWFLFPTHSVNTPVKRQMIHNA
jgi:hypothetical protein